MSQEKSAQNVFSSQLAGFGERLREAFNNASNVEIAKILGVTEAGVRNYLNGRIPGAETLLLIAIKTNRSIDWLIAGEGIKELVVENTTQSEPLPSKAEQLSGIFANLYERLEVLERFIPNLEKWEALEMMKIPPVSETLNESQQLNSDQAQSIANDLNIDFLIVLKVLSNMTEDIEPQIIRDVRDAAKRMTDKVTKIKDKLANG